VRTLVFPVLLILLSGCVPVGFTIASYAVDGASYAGSGKSLTDHMLSDWKGRDCATWRILRSQPICKDFTPEEIARRKKNREEIRHDVGHAYIATNLDGIDLDTGSTLAKTTTKTTITTTTTPDAKSRAVQSVTPGASGKPVRLKPAPVLREDLPPAGGRRGKPMVERPKTPNEARHARRVRQVPADSRYLVFGSFRHRSDAARFAGRHAVMGPRVVPVTVRGKRYYRVVVHADGREALATARHQLRRNGVKNAYTMRICRPGVRSAHCMKPIPTTHQESRSAARPVTGGG
jgi:cell division protein FtsN